MLVGAVFVVVAVVVVVVDLGGWCLVLFLVVVV